MASHFLLDANALAKRYLVELGTANVNHLFQHAVRTRLACLTLGTLETISVLVRARNRGSINVSDYQQALSDLHSEIVKSASVVKITPNEAQITAAAMWVEKHSVNATDALVLEISLEYVAQLKPLGDSLVLMSADRRLLNAAQAEGLVSYNPETQSQAELDVLLKS